MNHRVHREKQNIGDLGVKIKEHILYCFSLHCKLFSLCSRLEAPTVGCG